MPLVLAATLDTPAAGPLRLMLRQVIGRGEPLILDAGHVDRVGQACLQVLAAARTAATDASLIFDIVQPSTALVEMATLAGLATLVTA